MIRDWFGGGKDESIPELIKRRRYGRAIEIVLGQLEKQPGNERLRQQLAELYHLDGQGVQAIEVLKGIADEYARSGFTVKAIAVLKKIQRIDPSDGETDAKLTTMIKERDTQLVSGSAARSLGRDTGPFEIGMELVEDEEPELAIESAASGTAEWAVSDEGAGVIESAAASPAPSGLGATPLFRSFSQEELLAVIRGFELQSFEPGDIIVAAGEPGDSLFVVASGVVKAWVKDGNGHYALVREMGEGDFFGEISILSGQPRTATITSAEWSELLELDRATLDRISETHPNVREVLEEFYRQRLGSSAEKAIRGSDD